MRHALLVSLLSLVAALLQAVTATAQVAPTKAEKQVDYKSDIRPIFRRHCYQCHGPQKMEGGLRLDDRQSALLGGNSQESVLGGTLATNPLYLRITSTDPELRMPMKKPPLSAAEIETIARWIRQKTPWPAAAIPQLPDPLPPATEPGLLGWLGGIWDRIDAAFQKYSYLKRLAWLGIWLLGGALITELIRDARKKGKAWTTGKLRWFVSLVCIIRVSHFVVVLLGISLYVVWRDFDTKLTANLAERDRLRKSLAVASGAAPTSESVYGSPPVPNRPNKPKEISGTYYRGNCERNPKLFNGGNYRTATFHLSVVDAEHQQIKLGEAIQKGPVAIHFEIERAPKTADEFFTKKTTDRVFLAEKHANFPPKNPPTSKPVCLETIQPGQRWGGDYSIGDVPAEGRATRAGLIYVIVGILKGDDAVQGQIHYGIKYDLIFENGKLVEGSDVWMGELYITPPIAPPRPDKIPLDEWFDYRPIPEITGENSKDPKLLGIDTLSGGPGDPLSNPKPKTK